MTSENRGQLLAGRDIAIGDGKAQNAAMRASLSCTLPSLYALDMVLHMQAKMRDNRASGRGGRYIWPTASTNTTILLMTAIMGWDIVGGFRGICEALKVW